MKNSIYEISEREIIEFDFFYDGLMNEEDYFLTQAKMRLDEVFNHKYLVYKNLRYKIEKENMEYTFLKDRLLAIEYKQKVQKRRFYLTAYTSAICVFLFFLYTLFNTETKQHLALYEKYKNLETGLPINMAQNDIKDIGLAMIEIANEKYFNALQILSKCNSNDTSIYFSAYCNEQLGNYKKALSSYTKLANSSSDFIHYKSRYRKALVLLKQNHTIAKKEFKAIAEDEDNPYNLISKKIFETLVNH